MHSHPTPRASCVRRRNDRKVKEPTWSTPGQMNMQRAASQVRATAADEVNVPAADDGGPDYDKDTESSSSEPLAARLSFACL